MLLGVAGALLVMGGVLAKDRWQLSTRGAYTTGIVIAGPAPREASRDYVIEFQTHTGATLRFHQWAFPFQAWPSQVLQVVYDPADVQTARIASISSLWSAPTAMWVAAVFAALLALSRRDRPLRRHA